MSAILSPCGTYRYLLKRATHPMAPMKSTALFEMRPASRRQTCLTFSRSGIPAFAVRHARAALCIAETVRVGCQREAKPACVRGRQC
jgi:hypothetical protein